MPVRDAEPEDFDMFERKYEERWLDSTTVGDDSRERSGDEMLDVLDAPVEASDSSKDLVDEADEVESSGDVATGCRSYALLNRTFVVDRSSVGSDI